MSRKRTLGLAAGSGAGFDVRAWVDPAPLDAARALLANARA